jgi:hypothetical protein
MRILGLRNFIYVLPLTAFLMVLMCFLWLQNHGPVKRAEMKVILSLDQFYANFLDFFSFDFCLFESMMHVYMFHSYCFYHMKISSMI